MSERLRCELCGIVDHGVLWGRPVEWTDAERRRRPAIPVWESVNRCGDYQACRRRVEEAGRTWPVRDAVTRPTVKPAPEREEVPI